MFKPTKDEPTTKNEPTIKLEIAKISKKIKDRLDLDIEQGDFEITNIYKLNEKNIRNIFYDFEKYKNNILNEEERENIILILCHYNFIEELEELLLTSLEIKYEFKNKNIILRILKDFKYDEKIEAINNPLLACQKGYLDCLKIVNERLKKKISWDESFSINAAENGHLECLKYAHENGCPWNKMTTSNAAKNGHFECLKYAHENDCPWNKMTTSNAAKNGHFECLKYAYENGCLWDDWTTSCAAKNGHLECLKYAYENDCPWNHKEI